MISDLMTKNEPKAELRLPFIRAINYAYIVAKLPTLSVLY